MSKRLGFTSLFLIIVIVFVAIGSIGLWTYWSWNEPLSALQREFSKIHHYPGIIEVEDPIGDDAGGSGLGKCSGPQVNRSFTINNDSTKVEQFYREELKRDGWNEADPDEFYMWKKDGLLLEIFPPESKENHLYEFILSAPCDYDRN